MLFDILDEYPSTMFSPPTSTIPTPKPPTIPPSDDRDTANKNSYSQNAASHTSPALWSDELQNVKDTDNQYQASGKQGAIAESERSAISEGNMAQLAENFQGGAMA